MSKNKTQYQKVSMSSLLQAVDSSYNAQQKLEFLSSIISETKMRNDYTSIHIDGLSLILKEINDDLDAVNNLEVK